MEESGVLNGSLKSRGNSWGLHMPLVCPDGAVVAYAWKRQLAGQAGASAVDRTRFALLMIFMNFLFCSKVLIVICLYMELMNIAMLFYLIELAKSSAPFPLIYFKK